MLSLLSDKIPEIMETAMYLARHDNNQSVWILMKLDQFS